ncbi:MAG: MFS transporter [Candidatus Heimdallarchaeota archaeon]|nr:MAG: MFS transporter [Candidatus Heimdallarchaeota archaeon]
MVKESRLTPKITLISAIFVHGAVEIPYFIFPVILLVVESELIQELGAFVWIGLGSIGTIGAFAAGLPSPIFGWLADRHRRGLMMSLSLIIAALGALIIGLFGESFFVLMTGIGLTGLAIALYHPPGLSWISEAFVDPENQFYSTKFNRVLGIHGVGGTIGASIAELSVAFLYGSISWQEIYLLWVSPLIFLAFIFWILVGRYESHVEFNNPSPTNELGISHTEETATKLEKTTNSTMVIIFAFMFAMSLTWGMTSFILSPFLSDVKNFKISQAAFFVGFSHLIAASGQMLGGVLGDKYSEHVALSIAAVLQVIILIGIYIVDSRLPLIIFILYIFLGIVNSIFWPSTNSLLAKSTVHRGSAFGLFMITVNVVRALGPGIDGLILSLDPNNYLWIFILSCIFSVIAFICLIVLKNHSEKAINAV